MDNITSDKLSKRVKISFAVGQIGESAVYMMFLIYFVFFLTDIVGFDPAFAGLVSMVGVFWDAVTDPVVGSISDNAKFKSGRRSPFVLGFAVPFGVSTALLFTIFDLGPTALKAYFIIAIIVFFSCYTLWFVPYTALSAEMTQDYNERTSLHTYRGVGMTLGALLGALSPLLLVDMFVGMDVVKSSAWSFAGWILGAITASTFLIGWAGTKGMDLDMSKRTENSRQPSFFGRYAVVFANYPFRFICAITALTVLGFTWDGAIFMYYCTYYLGLSHKTISAIMAIAPLSALIYAPFVGFIGQRYGKKIAFVGLVGAGALIHASMFFLQPGNLFLFCTLITLSAIGTIGFWVLTGAMNSDVIEVDEWTSGERREGLYFGFYALNQKVGAALSMGLLGIFLSVIGYVANAEQTASTVFGLRIGYTLIGVIPILIAATICIFYPITAKKHKALREALAAKAAGEPLSTKGFEDLIPTTPQHPKLHEER